MSELNDEQIKHMVNRFLGWKLPDDFRPDGGISFEPEYNVEYNAKRGMPPARHEPVGTNLLSATQAEAMVRYMVNGLPAGTPSAFDEWWSKDGQYIDPDTSDVPWFDKRRGLAEYAFEAGRIAPSVGAGEASPQPAQAGMVLVPRSALGWLFGETPDADGKWFGEIGGKVKPLHALQGGRPRYWWRSHFRKLIAAATPAQAEGERAAVSRPEQGAGE